MRDRHSEDDAWFQSLSENLHCELNKASAVEKTWFPPNRWCCLICFMLFEGNMSIPEPSTWEESTVAGPSSMGRKVARTPATGLDVKARGLDTAGSPGTTNSNWIVIPFENGTLSHWKWGFNVWFSGGLSHFQVFFSVWFSLNWTFEDFVYRYTGIPHFQDKPI